MFGVWTHDCLREEHIAVNYSTTLVRQGYTELNVANVWTQTSAVCMTVAEKKSVKTLLICFVSSELCFVKIRYDLGLFLPVIKFWKIISLYFKVRVDPFLASLLRYVRAMDFWDTSLVENLLISWRPGLLYPLAFLSVDVHSNCFIYMWHLRLSQKQVNNLAGQVAKSSHYRT